jgi:hypothetical protein
MLAIDWSWWKMLYGMNVNTFVDVDFIMLEGNVYDPVRDVILRVGYYFIESRRASFYARALCDIYSCILYTYFFKYLYELVKY